jgi:ribosomal protein S18 acetylase RimI-like enzyme
MEQLNIIKFDAKYENSVIELWKHCNLLVKQNNPKVDIKEKMNFQPDLFFLGFLKKKLVSSIMIGYDGHRGWINYLAVHPNFQRNGIGTIMMDFATKKLLELGCQKINVQVRNSNRFAVNFYQKIGFTDDQVIGMGKRIQKR